MILTASAAAIASILRQIPEPSRRGAALIEVANHFGFACAVFTDVEVGDADIDKVEEQMVEAANLYLENA